MKTDSMVIRLDEEPVVDRGGGVRTWRLVTPQRGAVSFLSGITDFVPGASLAMHFHNCEESVVVLHGDAGFETDEGLVRMAPGMATFILAGVAHRFINLGDEGLRIHWTYGSIHATRTIVATGETREVGSEGR